MTRTAIATVVAVGVLCSVAFTQMLTGSSTYTLDWDGGGENEITTSEGGDSFEHAGKIWTYNEEEDRYENGEDWYEFNGTGEAGSVSKYESGQRTKTGIYNRH